MKGHHEQGSALVEFTTLTVILLVPLIYLVMTLAQIQAGSYAVSAAAREAGRAYVTAGTQAEAPARAEAASRIAFSDQGFSDGTVAVSCPSTPCLSPGNIVQIDAEIRVPLPLVPGFARDVVPLEVPLHTTYRTTVDRFRVIG